MERSILKHVKVYSTVNHSEYKLVIDANSYKDGTIELDVYDGNTSLNFTIITNYRKYINTIVMPAILKILNNIGCSISTTEKIHITDELMSIVKYASFIKGNMTENYAAKNYHGRLSISTMKIATELAPSQHKINRINPLKG